MRARASAAISRKFRRESRRTPAMRAGMSVFAYSPWFAPVLAAALSAAALGAPLAEPRPPAAGLSHPGARCTTGRCRGSAASRSGRVSCRWRCCPRRRVGGDPRWLVAVGARSPPCPSPTTGGACGPCGSPRASMRSRRWRSPSRCRGIGDAEGISPPHVLAVAGTVLAIVWSANLFNFMDGNDGLAALMSICGFGAYGVAAARDRDERGRLSSRSRRRRSRFSSSTCRRRGRSWVTAARSASGFSRRPSVSAAFARKSGRAGFRCSFSCRSWPTPR